MTIDPAEALRRIRARLVELLAYYEPQRVEMAVPAANAVHAALDIIDEEWPNGVELNPVAVDPPDYKPLTIATTDARLVATIMTHDDTTCHLCVFATNHGWWGRNDVTHCHGWWGRNDVTHCRGCGATWSRTTRQAECRACHHLFSTPRNLDRHIRKGGEHVHPTEVGLIFDVNQYGTPVWHQPASTERFRRSPQSDETALPAIGVQP